MKTIRNINLILLLAMVLFSACNTAEPEIEAKQLDAYKAELAEFVTAEKAKVQACVIGFNIGDFRTETNFESFKAAYLSALLNAETVINKANVTIAEIVAANNSLSVPGKNFTSNLWTADRRPLNDAIVGAEALFLATPEGTAVGMAPAADKAKFLAAINAAKAVRNTAVSIERQLDEAMQVLSVERAAFANSIIN